MGGPGHYTVSTGTVSILDSRFPVPSPSPSRLTIEKVIMIGMRNEIRFTFTIQYHNNNIDWIRIRPDQTVSSFLYVYFIQIHPICLTLIASVNEGSGSIWQ